MKRRLNVRLVASLLFAGVVVSVGVHFLHAFQVRRYAEGLLYQAERAEQEGQYRQAINYLSRYTALVPDNATAQANLGLLMADHGSRMRAFHVLERAVRLDPANQKARRRLVRLAMNLQRFIDAREHIEKYLLKSAPEDAELENLLGQCYVVGLADADARMARQCFERAIQHNSKSIDSYVRLAKLLRARPADVRNDDENNIDVVRSKADRVMRDLVAANGDSVLAFVAAARYQKEELQSFEAAERSLSRARELAPSEASVLLATADLALARHENAKDPAVAQQYLNEARSVLQKGIESNPKTPAFYQGLAQLEARHSNRSAAIDCLRRGAAAVEKPERALLLWDLADLLAQANDATGFAKIADELKRAGITATRREYLDARLLAAEGQWAKAARALEHLHDALLTQVGAEAVKSSPARSDAGSDQVREEADKIDLLLGYCYEQLGDAEQAFVAYDRAANNEAGPFWLAAQLGKCSALEAAGKVDDAVDLHYRLLASKPDNLQVRVSLIRLLLLHNRLRSWTAVERELAVAVKQWPNSVELVVLRAEKLAAQGELTQAQAELEKAQKRLPKQLELALALARMADGLRKPAGALGILDQAERDFGDRVEVRLARVDHWARAGGPEAPKALEKLGQGIQRFSKEEQTRLQTALAVALNQVGDAKAAAALWSRLVEQSPNVLSVHWNLFELAFRADDDAGMQRELEAIKLLEGGRGVLWNFGEASRLVRLGERGDKLELKKAHELFTSLAKKRPTWARVWARLGQVEDLSGNQAEAVKNYAQAISLGERDLAVLRRLTQLYFARQDYRNAGQVIKKLTEQGPLAADLLRLSAAVSWGARDYAGALENARKATENSKDFHDYLWLGQVAFSAGQTTKNQKLQAEAEKPFRKAVELGRGSPDAWVALIHYLVSTGQTAQAREEMKSVRLALAPDQGPLALAYCHELVGDVSRARELIEEALRARPNDPPVLCSAAMVYIRTGDLRTARLHLDGLIQQQESAPEEANWARQTKAILLASGGDYQQALRALDDPTARSAAAGEAPQDRLARAVVLGSQSSRTKRRQALEILKDVGQRGPLPPEFRFLAAQIHESLGNFSEARECMLSLLSSREGDQTKYLASYARGLLERNQLTDAHIWLDRLDPRSFAQVEIEARLLAKENKSEQAAKVLLSFVEKNPALAGPAATLLEELNRPAEAEAMIRQQVAQATRPETVLLLAQFLARQDRLKEALDICEQASKDCPEDYIASSSIAVLHLAKAAGPDEQVRVDRWLEGALRKRPTVALLNSQAALRSLQGRVPEAKGLYRETLTLDKNNTVALNNLAWLLAFGNRDEQAEALRLVNRAIEVAGLSAHFLDTRAAIYFRTGQYQEAIRDLEDAISKAASHYFHLAQVHEKSGNVEAAKGAWRKAMEHGLRAESLDLLERHEFASLAKVLE